MALRHEFTIDLTANGDQLRVEEGEDLGDIVVRRVGSRSRFVLNDTEAQELVHALQEMIG